MPELTVRLGGSSSAGIKNVNQDAFAAHTPKGHTLTNKGVVAAIADGISVSRNSHLASQGGVTQFVTDYYSTPETWSVPKSAARVLTALNSWMFDQNKQGGERSGLVTTFSALVLKSCSGWFFHAGDSRIYQYRQHKLTCLTRDHLQPIGGSHALSRALGIDNHLEVDTSRFELQAGDRYLLATDGLYRFVTPSQLQRLLDSAETDLERLAKTLCDLALAQGSNDNLTALLLEVAALPNEEIDEAHRRLTQLAIPPVMQDGQQIDGLTVRRVLFSGTRSHLYLVENEAGEAFALKVPSIQFSDDPAYLEGFLREEWLGKRLEHRGIMRIYPRPDGSRFMYHLCEYIEGQTLRQWMHDHPAPSLNQVRDIIHPLCRALRALQRGGMVHRDLKPENVMIDRHGQVKLIDFGTVQAEGLEEIDSPIHEDTPVGSVDYIAPEYLRGQRGTFLADLFSAAVITYEMLAGELPFRSGANPHHIPKSDKAWRYRPLRLKRNDLPLWLDLALERACSPQPLKRPQSFSEFLQDLKQPNPDLLDRHNNTPLMERNPLLFWKIVSLALLLGNLFLLLR